MSYLFKPFKQPIIEVESLTDEQLRELGSTVYAKRFPADQLYYSEAFGWRTLPPGFTGPSPKVTTDASNFKRQRRHKS
jgi:hypothetical protein